MPDLSKGETWEQNFRRKVRTNFPGLTVSNTRGMCHLKLKRANHKVETRFTAWPWSEDEITQKVIIREIGQAYELVMNEQAESLKEAIYTAQKNEVNEQIEEFHGSVDPNLEERVERTKKIDWLDSDKYYELLNSRDLEIESIGTFDEIFDSYSQKPYINLLMDIGMKYFREVFIKELGEEYVNLESIKRHKSKYKDWKFETYKLKLTIESCIRVGKGFSNYEGEWKEVMDDFDRDTVEIKLDIPEDGASFIKSMKRKQLYKDLNIDLPDFDDDQSSQIEEEEIIQENNDSIPGEEEVIF